MKTEFTKMVEKEEFDICDFLPDSLNLEASSMSSARTLPGVTKFEDPVLKLLRQDPYEWLGIRDFTKTEGNTSINTETPIQQFFRGANIFITGGTGFMGKVLTEKLLRCLPQINQVYLLVRPKRGNTSAVRYEQVLNDKVFDRMKAEVPHYRSKLTVINGDLALPDLGLTPADRLTLTDNVHVVFNSAADVRFVEPLRSSFMSNVVGTKRVLDLAKEMKNLKSFVHVSTAYSQCILRRVPEAVPKLPVSYKQIWSEVINKTEEQLDQETNKIMQGWPNTYTFTKAVCEDMLQEESKGMPICIFRPAVVGCTYTEPVRGWTDNLYGPLGLFVGSALGVIHCFQINQELSLDFVPVDYAINAIITAAWKCEATRYEESIRVYNFIPPDSVKRNWKTAINCGLNYRDYFPYKSAIYYTAFIRSDKYLVDELGHIFLHKLPGKLIDKVLEMCGQKPRLSKVYDRISSIKEALRFFSARVWEFDNKNLSALDESLSEEDQQLFGFNMKDISMVEYFFISKLGIRYFYLKESFKNLPSAQNKNKWLKTIHYSLKMATGLVVLKGLVLVANTLPI